MSCRPRTPSSKRSGFIEPWRKYLPTPWVASAPENGPGGEGACHQAPVAPHGKVCSPARAYTGARIPWLSGQTQLAPNLAEEAANLPARRHGAGAGKGSIAGHPALSHCRKEERENSASRIFSSDRDCGAPRVHSGRAKDSVGPC